MSVHLTGNAARRQAGFQIGKVCKSRTHSSMHPCHGFVRIKRSYHLKKGSTFYGVKVIVSVTHMPLCPVSEQSVMVARSLCPVGS